MLNRCLAKFLVVSFLIGSVAVGVTSCTQPGQPTGGAANTQQDQLRQQQMQQEQTQTQPCPTGNQTQQRTQTGM